MARPPLIPDLDLVRRCQAIIGNCVASREREPGLLVQASRKCRMMSCAVPFAGRVSVSSERQLGRGTGLSLN